MGLYFGTRATVEAIRYTTFRLNIFRMPGFLISQNRRNTVLVFQYKRFSSHLGHGSIPRDACYDISIKAYRFLAKCFLNDGALLPETAGGSFLCCNIYESSHGGGVQQILRSF